MTVQRCRFGKLYRSDVKQILFFVVLLTVLDYLPLNCQGQDFDRDARRLFGGYRITPTYCKASRTARYNRGNTICMFNHECTQRGGEVVGTCMDGFLFGACCQLKSDSQSHIPKGPGVVVPGYTDYSEMENEGEEYDSFEQLDSWHNSFKPVVTPGYRPSDKNVYTTTITTTEPNYSTESEILSEGLSHITNTLLNTPPKDSNIAYIKPGKPDSIYTHSTIEHGVPDTILLHEDGSEVEDIARPSDFNIQVSSMQTKPTVAPSTTSQSTPTLTISTHRPVYKPIFRPKPVNKPTSENPSTENYVEVPTVTKETQKISELSSINSIIQMLNESTPSMKEEPSSYATIDMIETKSSPIPSSTQSYQSSAYPIHRVTTGHYVTMKPSSYPNNWYTSGATSFTQRPTTLTSKPSYSIIYTTPNIISQETIPEKAPQPDFSSPEPSQSTSQAIEAFNRYPNDPSEFGQTVTTFSYVSSTTTKPTPTTRKPPSTSYVTGVKPSRKPVTDSLNTISTYNVAQDTFSSATPTVILLNNLETSKPGTPGDKEPEFVEISQEPYKKPVNQITVNNVIESTNNIYVNKPPQKFDKPASPTVVITPKPSPSTSPYPVKSSTKPVSVLTSDIPSFDSYTELYSPTTMRPELQTSTDDLINFPPVRNPMFNATGSNVVTYNTSIDNDLDNLQELEFTTPSWHEDDKLNEKMNLFVNKIVGSLQGTFQELHDIVILDKKPNATIIKDTKTTTTLRPTRKTPATTRRPVVTTKKPNRITTTRKTPVRTTKKPTRLTTAVRRPTTTPTVPTTTKKTVTTTKKPKPTKKVTTTTVTPSTTTELYDDITTESYTEQIINYDDRSLCGVRPLVKSGRIVGGKNASFGDWPWQVLIRESTWLGLFTKNKCGGVLITNRFVTTAAHCQPGFMGSLVAVFGENDISTNLEPRRPVAKNVRRVIPHPKYDAATFENDLAILELDSPIKYEPHIVPICMPPDDADFTNRMATVTGWGRLKYGGGVPAILQEVQVPVMENSHCQYMFQTAGHAKKILDSFICAGYSNGKKDSCEGDSGGPLVVRNDDGRWVLVGTVSHGIKCAARFLPGVYMRTTYYKPWFRSITGVK
ncbi:serine protease filzig isoform X2 [Papilio machaon]|uniref:serine protease filzig isoform X2 n=1 Tax=Papilio machaon TaxID=76193 RepID=UPI001E663720|nr:serine protease filzig isoform X2 [Papilio machaon]